MFRSGCVSLFLCVLFAGSLWSSCSLCGPLVLGRSSLVPVCVLLLRSSEGGSLVQGCVLEFRRGVLSPRGVFSRAGVCALVPGVLLAPVANSVVQGGSSLVLRLCV